MNTITLDAEGIHTITSSFGTQVKICDEAGKVCATIVPVRAMTVAEMEALFTPEQLARRADPSKPRYTTEDILKLFDRTK